MLVQTRATCSATSGKLEGWFLVVRSIHLVCPENEMRATPIRIVDTSGGFAGLVLPLSKCLVNRDSETNRVFPGEGLSFVDRESL